MTIACLLLFTAYNSVQNLQSSLLGQTGYYSLMIIYISLCITTLLFSGQVVHMIKPKWALAVGATCYVAFIIANRWPSIGSLYPTAAILGFGGGILWAAQGTYLTIASSNYAESRNQTRVATMGLFTGIFFGIFQISQVIGNLISSFVLQANSTEEEGGPPQDQVNKLMIIYIVIASVGCGALYFLPNEESSSATEVVEESSILSKVFRVVLQLKDLRMILLLPVFFFSGLEQGFVFGSYPHDIITPAAGVGQVGFVMAVFGGTNTIASFSMGQISDRWGNKPVVAMGYAMHLTFYLFFFLRLSDEPISWFSDRQYLLYLGAVVYAVGDACMNTFPSIMCSLFFTDDAEAAFSNFKFFQALGSVLAFALANHVDVQWKIVLCIALQVLSAMSLFVLHLFVSSIDGKDAHKVVQLE